VGVCGTWLRMPWKRDFSGLFYSHAGRFCI